MEKYDIAIVGAGVAGTIAGYVAARLNRSTVMIDDPPRGRPGEVLAHGGISLLERLGLGHLAHRAEHVAFDRVARNGVWSDADDPSRGIILDRTKFESDLIAAAVDAGCVRLCGKVEAIDRAPFGGHVLTARGPEDTISLAARIIIDASGRKAVAVRKLGGVRCAVTNLVAGCAALPVGAIDAAPGYFALETGARQWWYVAVGRGSIGAAVLGRRPPLDAEAWIGAARSTRILRDLSVRIPVRPLARAGNVSLTRPVAEDDWFAAGDAAATFDPLSGYGLTFAIGTGHAAACAADTRLRGRHMAPQAYQAVIEDRIARATAGLNEAYGALSSMSPSVVH